jgi:hypothetical protein
MLMGTMGAPNDVQTKDLVDAPKISDTISSSVDTTLTSNYPSFYTWQLFGGKAELVLMQLPRVAAPKGTMMFKR